MHKFLTKMGRLLKCRLRHLKMQISWDEISRQLKNRPFLWFQFKERWVDVRLRLQLNGHTLTKATTSIHSNGRPFMSEEGWALINGVLGGEIELLLNTWCQFYQHFTRRFYDHSWSKKLHAKLLYKKPRVKRWWIWYLDYKIEWYFFRFKAPLKIL